MKTIFYMCLLIHSLVLVSCTSLTKKDSETSDLDSLKNVSSELHQTYSEYKNIFDFIFLDLRNLPVPEQDDSLTAQLLLRIDEKLNDSQQLVYDRLIDLEIFQKKLQQNNSDEKNQIQTENNKFIELLKTETLKLTYYKKDLSEAKKLLVNSINIYESRLSFTDLNFSTFSKEISVNKEQSKNAFDRMVLYANSCPEVKFEIHDHASNNMNSSELSLKRAQAVKKKLIQSGVKSEKITAVKGFASSQNLIVEPNIGSFEEKNMEPRELEYIRSVNNRIEFKIAEPCRL